MGDHVVGLVGAETEEARGDDAVLPGVDLVSGDLLADEAVEGAVLVEDADDVVPVAPERRPVAVDGEAVGVGVAHDVEPVPRPALAVARRREEAVDDGGRRLELRPGVADVGVDILRGRGETREVDGDAADPDAARHRGSRFEAARLQPCEDESVDGVFLPRRVVHRGRRRRPEDGLEGRPAGLRVLPRTEALELGEEALDGPGLLAELLEPREKALERGVLRGGRVGGLAFLSARRISGILRGETPLATSTVSEERRQREDEEEPESFRAFPARHE